ncbi:MAG: glycosyltransferase WbuB [Planctomycetaceae bacterium]|nr:glycosyltransferase WbuB [Planctomycetaceae bacterium]
MRILYFYQYFTTPKGAYSTRVYEFARRWCREGDSVTVITSVYDKSDLQPQGLIDRIEIEGIDVRIVNISLSNSHGFVTRLLTFLAYSIIASWYAIRLPVDVVVASSGPLTVGIPGLIARYIRRRPLIFEVRDLWPEGAIQLGILRNRFLIALATWLERACYHAADHIVALSEGMADWIRETYEHDHIAIIPNAADNRLFSTTTNIPLPGWADHTSLVLYTGSIGAMNDCWQIIRMAEQLKSEHRDDIHVVLIGDGRDRPAIEQYVKQYKLDNVKVLGPRPKEEVAAWLAKSTCAILAFRDKPCLDTVSPNKMFDAFAAGVPVVQATQGWIKRLMERRHCGITTSPSNAEEFAAALIQLTEDAELQSEMSRNARQVAEEEFDRDLLAQRFRNVMLDAVHPHSAPQQSSETSDPLAQVKPNEVLG